MNRNEQGQGQQAEQQPEAATELNPTPLADSLVQAVDRMIQQRMQQPATEPAHDPQEAPAVIGVVPESQRAAGERNAPSVGAQRDIDGPDGVYVQTHRMFKHLGTNNTQGVHRAQELMQRAGMYDNAAWSQYMGEQRAVALTSSEGTPFLPTTVENTIEELREEFGAMRQICNVFNFSSGSHKIPNVSGRPDVFAVNEGSDIKMRKATWGSVTLDPKKWGLLRAYSTEMNDEVGAQWVRKTTEQVGRAFAKAEDETVLIADGSATYHSLTGLLESGSVTQYTMAATNTSFDNWTYADGIGAMKLTNAGNRSMGYHVAHPDIALIMALFENGNNQYIYPPNSEIDRLVRPFVFTEAMPDIGDDAVSTNFHTFGDFSHVHIGVQRGVDVKLLDQATILDTDDSTQIRLGSMDSLALRFTARWDVKIGLYGSFVKTRTAAS